MVRANGASMLTTLLTLEFFPVFLVFCRVGAIFMVIPTFGEAYISARVRLLLALTFTLLVTPVVTPLLPTLPSGGILAIFVIVAAELIIGLFMGGMIRVMVAALATAGTLISFVTGFANAVLFNPGLGDQGSLQSVFLSLLGTLLILVMDLHHVMLRGMVDSYMVFQPGLLPPAGDISNAFARAVADSFILAFKLASPFIVIAVVFFALLGLMARLMPQLQVFFLAMPLQILLGLYIMLIAVPAIMTVFLTKFSETLAKFLQFGAF